VGPHPISRRRFCLQNPPPVAKGLAMRIPSKRSPAPDYAANKSLGPFRVSNIFLENAWALSGKNAQLS
jgi:hypothetical protein